MKMILDYMYHVTRDDTYTLVSPVHGAGAFTVNGPGTVYIRMVEDQKERRVATKQRRGRCSGLVYVLLAGTPLRQKRKSDKLGRRIDDFEDHKNRRSRSLGIRYVTSWDPRIRALERR